MKTVLIILALVFTVLTSPAQSDNLRRDFAMLLDCHDGINVFTANETTQLVFESINFNSDFEAIDHLRTIQDNNDILFFFETLEFEFMCIGGPGYYRCFSEENVKRILNL